MAECYSETCNERQLRWETDLWWDTTFTVTWPYISIHLRLQWKTTWHIRPFSVSCLSSQVSLYMQFPSCLFWKVARLDIYLSQICCLSYMIVDLLLYISVDCGHPSLLMRRQTWAVKDSPTPSCPILVCMQCSSISKYRIHFDTLHPLKLDFNLSHYPWWDHPPIEIRFQFITHYPWWNYTWCIPLICCNSSLLCLTPLPFNFIPNSRLSLYDVQSCVYLSIYTSFSLSTRYLKNVAANLIKSLSSHNPSKMQYKFVQICYPVNMTYI